MKKILPIVLIALAATLSGCTLPGQKLAPVACTMEAKICPDGSSVGRTGPKCEFTACPATSTTKMANPASVNCKNKGGTLVIKTKPDGSQYGLCYFDDNRACEEWAMMRGDCPVGGMKTTGYDTEAQRYCAWSGGSTYAVENAVCIFKDGSQCSDEAFYTGTCQKGQNKSTNVFNIKNAKVGDKVAGMTIKSIEKIDKQQPISETNASILFTGQATITGNYQYQKISDIGGVEALYISDLIPASELLIPKISNDPAFFTLINIVDAKKALGITTDNNTGIATITIADYKLIAFPSEVPSSAKFIK